MKRKVGIAFVVIIVFVIGILMIWIGVLKRNTQVVESEQSVSAEIPEDTGESSQLENVSETVVDENSEMGFEQEETTETEEIYTVSLKEALKWDQVLYGSYEQDNDLSNGAEPIEWIVLERKEDKVLVISKYVLDVQPYNATENHSYEDTTWETCTLRTWLNKTFCENAFTKAEQEQIEETAIENTDNEIYGIDGGNDTVDKIFLLSDKEAIRYFDMKVSDLWYGDIQSDAACTKPTEYALAKGILVLNKEDGHYIEWEEQHDACEGNCFWWLRTPGNKQFTANNIYWDGRCVESGNGAQAFDGVRPAMWVEL